MLKLELKLTLPEILKSPFIFKFPPTFAFVEISIFPFTKTFLLILSTINKLLTFKFSYI
jgi:hypothetical protein